MAKDKTDAGSWKLIYDISVKDPDADALMYAKMKHNQGKIRVTMGGGIPDMTKESLAMIALLLTDKIDHINNTLATGPGGHVAALRMIGAYCSELANRIDIGSQVEDV